MAKKKTAPECPITYQQFQESAPDGEAVMQDIGLRLELQQKLFQSTSFGYYGNGKITIKVKGVPVKCQVGIIVTVIGSRDAE